MENKFMQISIELALEGIEKKGHGPFGAVVVKDKEIVGYGTNQVTVTPDPTAHAEICAIRDACRRLKDFSLKGCEIYTSCEPCPMCLGAIYWARINKIYYGASRVDAALANFDDHNFYEELSKPIDLRAIPMQQMMRTDCVKIFDAWEALAEKVLY